MPIPKIQVALNGWESPVTLIKVTQSIVDYETVNVEEEISFQGVVQPLTAEALQLKPLETRSWEWLMIHTRTSAEIFTNDLIRYDGKEYKVMFEKNYSLNGYYEYHLVKNYE
jgi:hypothetical protein